MGREGMVAASQPLAVACGLNALQRGGTAADAAVAVAAALNLTEPDSTGLGGDAFALFYEACSQKVNSLNGSGRAPADLTLARLQNEGFEGGLPERHPYTITVPGACAAWCDLVERFGRLPLSTSLAPAIRLAEEGFPVAPVTATNWDISVRKVLNLSLNGRELTIEGRAPHAGEIFRNPGLANTLKAICEGGKREFYEGSLAGKIVAVVQKAGGCLSMADLAAHCSTWDEAISTVYRAKRIWECPPNGQGLAALLALNLLESFNLGSLAPYSPQRLHLEIEAMRLAFLDARSYVADPKFSPIPIQELLSKNYAASRRSLIQTGKVNLTLEHGTPETSSDTVYFSVVDKEGNACSFINSNYMGFGTGIVPQGCGFSLQNRGLNFNLEAGHPNMLEPGKRPYHTIIPAMATNEDGSLYACLGVMGGFMQPQGHLQVLIAMLDDGLDVQAALDRSRFCIELEENGGGVALEEGIPVRTKTELAQIGHRVTIKRHHERSLFGRGQIIWRDPGNGVLWGGSDPRADGCAMCLDGYNQI